MLFSNKLKQLSVLMMILQGQQLGWIQMTFNKGLIILWRK